MKIQSICLSILLLPYLATAKLDCYHQDAPLWITPQAGSRPIITAINHAKKSIQVVTYTMTNNSVINALIQAKNRGDNVQVLLDKAPYLATNTNLRATAQLKNAEIAVKTQNSIFENLHQKALIIDNQTAYLMTGNFTYSGFNFQRNFILKLSKENLVKQIETVFQADWQYKIPVIHRSVLVWSPENHGRWIIDLIYQAHRSIDIYAPGFGSRKFINAISNRARHGVKINFITRPTKQRGYKRMFKKLQRYGVNIIFMHTPTLHAKMILVDDHIAYLGSNNFTSTSFNENRELGIIICNSSLINKLEQQFNIDKLAAAT